MTAKLTICSVTTPVGTFTSNRPALLEAAVQFFSPVGTLPCAVPFCEHTPEMKAAFPSGDCFCAEDCECPACVKATMMTLSCQMCGDTVVPEEETHQRVPSTTPEGLTLYPLSDPRCVVVHTTCWWEENVEDDPLH